MNKSVESIKISETDYAPYYKGYVDRVKPGSIDEILTQDDSQRRALFSALNDKSNLSGYAPGKWSVKAVLQHAIDTERIFTVRALMISRGETKEIAGYDHNVYTANSNAETRQLVDLKQEWNTVRQATVSLFESFQIGDFKKKGVVNGNNLTIQAITYIIIGHALHHFQVLRDKYGINF